MGSVIEIDSFCRNLSGIWDQKVLRRFLLAAITVILFPLTAAAQPEGEFGTWPFPEAVDSLPDGTHPGQPFNGFPGNYRKNIDWMAIPQWMAGDWLSKDYRILKTYDHVNNQLKTIPSSTIAPFADHFGDQIDRQGTVWSCNFTPFITNIKLENLIDSQLTIGVKPLETRDDQVALWNRVLHVLYEPNSQRIHDSYTEERVTEFAPSGPMMITAQSTSRFYNPDGDPIFTTNSVRLMRLTQQFRPQRQRNGVDLPQSLFEYFQATGRSDLISNE